MPQGWRALGIAATLCAAAGASPALGSELAKLLPADGGLEDYFGHAVAIAGTTAVVATQCDDDNGENAGAVYVFRYAGTPGAHQIKLMPADPAASDLFGVSLAIEGNTIVVGAEEDDDAGTSSGSAYVFRFDGDNWVQTGKLVASDGAEDALFGHSVALSENTIVVGTAGYDLTTDYTGSAYVFHFDGSTWTEQAKLSVTDPAEADLFGLSVAVDGDVAVLAAPYDDVNGRESGSVYVFRRTNGLWTQEQKITPADGAAKDFFGWSVALDGDTLLVGAHRDDPLGDDSGSAYVYCYDGSSWTLQATLTPPDGDAGDHFGARVALAAGKAAIAAPHDSNHAGSAYVYRTDGTTWTYQRKLQPSDGASWDQFGSSVAIAGNLIVLGARRDDDLAINSGSAYVFHTEPCPGDLDGDSDIDLADLAQLLAGYGTTSGATYADGDIDGDGDVDLSDLAALLGVYNQDC